MAQNPLYWNGKIPAPKADYAFSGGSGAQNDPYLISTADDFAQLSANVAENSTSLADVYFRLTNDIYMNDKPIDPSLVDPSVAGPAGYAGGTGNVYEWLPIGGGATPTTASFRGYFNGCGHTIYNAFYNQQTGDVPTGPAGPGAGFNIGIFGNLFHTGTVCNLNTAGGYIGAQRSVGGIVGRNWGHLYNCHNGNFVYSANSQGAGGVAGASWTYLLPDVRAERTKPSIDRCSNSGTIVSNFRNNAGNPSGAAGGIVGENEGDVINSWNTGTVSGLRNAGGIVGSNQTVDSNLNPTVTIPGLVANCYNNGAIGTFNGIGAIPAVSATDAGGIMAFQQGSAANVYNIGTISGVAGAAIGQIVGHLNAAADAVNTNYNILRGTNAVGNATTTAPDAIPFENSPNGKTDLKDSLNGWVTNLNDNSYRRWVIDESENDGFPILNNA